MFVYLASAPLPQLCERIRYVARPSEGHGQLVMEFACLGLKLHRRLQIADGRCEILHGKSDLSQTSYCSC